MKQLSLILLIALCVAATAWAGPADRHVSTGPLGELQPVVTPLGAAGDCVAGNLEPVAFAITDWIWGAEAYSTVFFADPAGCPNCTEGFTMEAVTMYMNFAPGDVPASFDAYVEFNEAAYDDVSQCHVPGAAICTSPSYTVNIANPGLYAITLPMGACECAHFGYWYAATMVITSAFPPTQRPDAVTDQTPAACESYNDYGTGWQDVVVDFGFPGNLSIYADLLCCSNPVAVDPSTWGTIKSMFR